MEEPASNRTYEFSLERGLQIRIPDDRRIAHLVAKPQYLVGGGDVNLAMAAEVMDKSGLNRDRLNLTALESALKAVDEAAKKNEATTMEFTIAEAIPPKEGKDGWIKFFFPRAQRVVLKEDGSADFRNINKYVHVKDGEKLCTMFEGIPGEQGIDVLGQPIYPRQIEKPTIVVGRNVTSSTIEDPENPGLQLKEFYATLSGAVFSTDNSLTVSPELSIDTNVGLGTGNINFDGTIRVKGTIEEGANVICNGSLYVDGNVETYDLVVAEDLEVKGGIKAKAKGFIRVKGDLKAKFIENTSIEIDGDCIVENFILNSKVYVLGNLLLSGDSSSLVGSEVQAYKGVSVASLGSQAMLDTTVEVGFHFKNDKFFNEGSNRLAQLERDVETLQPEIQKIKEAVQRARGKLDDAKKARFKEIFDGYAAKAKSLELLKAKIEELKTARYNSEPVKVVVRNTGYPGATIKYRRQIEKLSKQQTSFMMQFQPGQEKAIMVAWKAKS